LGPTPTPTPTPTPNPHDFNNLGLKRIV